MMVDMSSVIIKTYLLWQAFALTLASGDGREKICKLLGDFYIDQCSNVQSATSSENNTTAPTRRGIPGRIGPQGPPAIVDKNANDELLSTVKNTFDIKLDIALNKLAQMERTLDSAVLQKTGHKCELQYDGKCFIAIIRKQEAYNFSAAKVFCYRIGWNLANVYSMEHYDLIVHYLRNVSRDYFTTVWLGMTWDPNEKAVYFRNGTRSLTDLPWYPNNFPMPQLDHIQMNIDIRTDPTSSWNGMANYPIKYARQGALCEI